MHDVDWMRLALEEARKALKHHDVPVGAVAVRQGRVIGVGHNERELTGDPTAHAEIIALRQAAMIVGHWRLDDVTLYCTLEPCCMCAGAIVLARIPRLVYGAIDLKAGCGGSVMDVLRHSKLNHRVDVQMGLLADESAELLTTFFDSLRH
ncbi:MAG: tRNA adenosine(34) deaminase TadA [Phototrophicales bacterium]|nr:MAG: tRNA adenosine(34) deaminase TadA [Phototrophicales bacterium]RMG70178.1 MAG: tRNA adenosine(34) deaminase TadA [Chloroflexota bacterium]